MKVYIKLLYKNLYKYICYCFSNKYISILFLILFLSVNIFNILNQINSLYLFDPNKVINYVLIELVILLLLVTIFSYKFFKYILNDNHNIIHNINSGYSSLQKKIILSFSVVSTIPTIIVSVFSVYFFNSGLQVWFDKKIIDVLDNSINVAQSYIYENKISLKESAISMADDLNEMYYNLIRDPVYFDEAINAEAEMRSMDEAIVFQNTNKNIISQTPLSFLLNITNIHSHLFEKADLGEIVEVYSDDSKIRVLIKLNEYEDTYLLVGRLIDRKVIDHINKTTGAASKYLDMKSKISNMQVKFSIIFIIIAIILLMSVIIFGGFLASKIVKPILNLVAATNDVKNGNLDVRVPDINLKDDEIKLLSSTFNSMISQLKKQKRDLIIAQRALAWSDVARKVAHEIKNPLTPIHLSAERLLQKFSSQIESDKESYKRYVNTIIKNTNDIKRIVTEFVDFARLPKPVFKKYDLVSIVSDIVESRSNINNKIRYNFIYNKNKIEFVCDIDQMRQVITNLLKNAEEALENVINPEIKLEIISDKSKIEIVFEDNGLGFDSEIIHKYTDAYFTTKKQGMGIGLAIVKRITEDHLGKLDINNKSDNNGAFIKLTFNIEELVNKL